METYTPDTLLAGDYPVVTDIVTILSGRSLVRGACLGKVARAAPAGAAGTADAGNTGNGTLTGVVLGENTKVGTYTLTCITEAANGGVFSVMDPDGVRLADATVGVEYANDHLGFTINDGSTDFAAGDVFTIAVAAGSEKYVLADKDAVDGSEIAEAILAEDCDATSADAQAVVYLSGAFNEDAVVFATDNAADDHRAALRQRNIYLKKAVSA